MRLGGFFEPVTLVDLDADVAGGHVREELLREAFLLDRVRDVVGERGARTKSEPLSASCIASMGGIAPEAVPTHTIRPRRWSESSEAAKVSLPTVS